MTIEISVSCQLSQKRRPRLPAMVNALRIAVVIADDVAAASW